MVALHLRLVVPHRVNHVGLDSKFIAELLNLNEIIERVLADTKAGQSHQVPNDLAVESFAGVLPRVGTHLVYLGQDHEGIQV